MDYRTQAGDTLTAIAGRFHVALADLETANPQIADPNLIFPNELIHIPSAHDEPHHVSTVPPLVSTYVVAAGDTMSGIAATHGVTLGALEAANPQVTDPSVIEIGQLLNLPRGNSHQPIPTHRTERQAAIPVESVGYSLFTGGGGLQSWITDACGQLGVPAEHWVRGYTVLCTRESSGRANAINNWDTNAWGPRQADHYPLHCSRGVAQCIPDTFARHHQPGTSNDIYNPIANIASSMNYVLDAYGVVPDGSNLAMNVQQADPTQPPRGY